MMMGHDDKLVEMKLWYTSGRVSSDIFCWSKSEGNVSESLLAAFGDVIGNCADFIWCIVVAT